MTKDLTRRLGVLLASALAATCLLPTACNARGEMAASGHPDAAGAANATRSPDHALPDLATGPDRRMQIAKKDTKTQDEGAAAKSDDTKKAGKPQQVGTFGDWGAYIAQGGKDKTCYALAQPKDRAPPTLKRDPAYLFISSRPGENVRNEVSIIMGFPLKDSGPAKAEVAGTTFDLVVKGTNAWIKNQADEAKFVEALKKGSKLVVRAPSAKGNVTTDSYSLTGVAQALEKAQKECF